MTRRIAALVVLAMAGGLLAACGSSQSSIGAETTAASFSLATGPARLGPGYDTTTTAPVTLNGAGANSINPFFQKVFYDYHLANKKTTVNYSPAGSSVGETDIEQNTIDFGDTEVPMSAADLAKATEGTVLQIPVDLGGIAISYNLPGAPKSLKLDGPTLAEIFDGAITNWNDPRIAAVTGVSKLPNLAIVPVHRADSSGPGWDLDDYLIKSSPQWVAKIGTSKPSKTWPLASVGIGEQLNTGVANYVHQTRGAIGFVEYGYSLEAGFTDAALKNKAGAFVAPSEESIGAAGTQAAGLSASNFSIIDEPGAGTYPLTNFSWTLLYQKQASQAKGLAAGKLFDWVVTTGQKQAAKLGYAPLPLSVVALARHTIEKLETSTGQPLFTP